jgi:transcriptional regulator with XRE-family HTH domain
MNVPFEKEPSAVDLALGARIRRRRRELGLSGGRLGELLKVSTMQISKYENGKHRIAAARLYEVSEALDVPVSYFFEDLPTRKVIPSVSVASLKGAVGDLKDPLEDLMVLGQLAAKIDDPKEKALIRRLLQRLPIFRDETLEEKDERIELD